MAEVDTSIYGHAPAAPNMLNTLGQYQGVANSMVQNQLLRQELPIMQQKFQQEQMATNKLQGIQKARQILANHMNDDNTFDYNGALADMAKDPVAALAIPEVQQERAQNNASTQSRLGPNGQPMFDSQQKVAASFNPGPKKLPQQQIDDAHAHADDMQKTLKDLIDLPDDQLNLSTLFGAGADLITKNAHSKGKLGASPQEVASALSGPDLPREDEHGNEPSPQAIRDFLQKHYDTTVQNQALLTHHFGPPTSAQQATAPSADNPSGERPMSPAPGFAQNLANKQQYYQNVMKEADSAKVENAALSNIYTLSKSGAPTGQVLGSFYSWLAEHNLAPAGAQTDAEKIQFINSHAAQIATAGGNRTDQDLFAKQLANVTEQNLPKVIQGMVPYLQGVRDMKISQAQHLHAQDPQGIDPDKIGNVQSFFQKHSDPRIWELARLRKLDPEAFKQRIKSLDPADAAELGKSSKELYNSKIIGD